MTFSMDSKVDPSSPKDTGSSRSKNKRHSMSEKLNLRKMFQKPIWMDDKQLQLESMPSLRFSSALQTPITLYNAASKQDNSEHTCA